MSPPEQLSDPLAVLSLLAMYQPVRMHQSLSLPVLAAGIRPGDELLVPRDGVEMLYSQYMLRVRRLPAVPQSVELDLVLTGATTEVVVTLRIDTGYVVPPTSPSVLGPLA